MLAVFPGSRQESSFAWFAFDLYPNGTHGELQATYCPRLVYNKSVKVGSGKHSRDLDSKQAKPPLPRELPPARIKHTAESLQAAKALKRSRLFL